MLANSTCTWCRPYVAGPQLATDWNVLPEKYLAELYTRHCNFHSPNLCWTKIYWTNKPRGALPYVGRCHLPGNRPLFDVNLTPTDPFFHCSSHQMTRPFFFKISTFRAHFENLKLSVKNGKLSLKFETKKNGMHRMPPPLFWEVHTKKRPYFFDHPPIGPLFAKKGYTECPLFSFPGRHIYPSLSYSSAPPSPTPVTYIGHKWISTECYKFLTETFG